MPDSSKDQPGQLKGFYGKVKISAKTLDVVIVVLVIALLAVLAMGLNDPGYTVTFDSAGGTFVEPQEHMYGELLDPVANPTREGWEFAGWYRDRMFQSLWTVETDKVIESITLYARWIPKSE